LDAQSFLIIYKGFVRPHLEYAIQSWSPYLHRDIDCLEKVQRRATKVVKGLQVTIRNQTKETKVHITREKEATRMISLRHIKS